MTPIQTRPQKQPQDISEEDATPVNKTTEATTRRKAKDNTLTQESVRQAASDPVTLHDQMHAMFAQMREFKKAGPDMLNELWAEERAKHLGEEKKVASKSVEPTAKPVIKPSPSRPDVSAEGRPQDSDAGNSDTRNSKAIPSPNPTTPKPTRMKLKLKAKPNRESQAMQDHQISTTTVATARTDGTGDVSHGIASQATTRQPVVGDEDVNKLNNKRATPYTTPSSSTGPSSARANPNHDSRSLRTNYTARQIPAPVLDSSSTQPTPATVITATPPRRALNKDGDLHSAPRHSMEWLSLHITLYRHRARPISSCCMNERKRETTPTTISTRNFLLNQYSLLSALCQ